MFSGIGGFELGIERAIRGECIGFSEIDKNAISIYKHHFPMHHNYGDASRIDERTLPDFDLLVGGFPCQAFSVAGKRLGFNDTRGTLFFEIARILAHKRPRHFLLENVKGLLSHDEGKTFAAILGVLSDLGYRVEWQVLNSKDFGVPQNRERVFFVGHLGDGCPGKIFHFGEDDRTVAGVREQQPVANTITARYEGSQATWSYVVEGKLNAPEELTKGRGQAERVYSIDGIATTQNALGGGGGAKTGLYAIPVLTPDRPAARQNGRRFKENGEPSFTVTAQDQHGVYDGFRIRRLTPRECERLQGFPDDWTRYADTGKEMSDSARYKACGNAVTVNVIEAIIRRFHEGQAT